MGAGISQYLSQKCNCQDSYSVPKSFVVKQNGVQEKKKEEKVEKPLPPKKESTAKEKKKNVLQLENQRQIYEVGIENFDKIKVLGRGTFGKVFLAQHKATKEFFAMKRLKKTDILNRKQLEHAFNEKQVLKQNHHPFVVKLRYAFQTEDYIYFIMEYLQGGELFFHLKQRGRFDESTVCFFAAQVVLALEYLHEDLNIIYRDLKPENILLGTDGYIKLSDFGLATSNKSFHNTFCGTPEYLAPEILVKRGHGKPVDFWTLGCLVYEMMEGHPPFQDQQTDRLFQKILTHSPKFTSNFSPIAQDLISNLIVRDPDLRLTVIQIKKHSFFSSIDWEKLKNKQITPPFRPQAVDPYDTKNFIHSNNIVNQWETMVDKKIDKDEQQLFSGFSYKDSFDQQLEASIQKLNNEKIDGEETNTQLINKISTQPKKKQNSVEKDLYQLYNNNNKPNFKPPKNNQTQ